MEGKNLFKSHRLILKSISHEENETINKNPVNFLFPYFAKINRALVDSMICKETHTFPETSSLSQAQLGRKRFHLQLKYSRGQENYGFLCFLRSQDTLLIFKAALRTASKRNVFDCTINA